jgi:hypothetical protein
MEWEIKTPTLRTPRRVGIHPLHIWAIKNAASEAASLIFDSLYLV